MTTQHTGQACDEHLPATALNLQSHVTLYSLLVQPIIKPIGTANGQSQWAEPTDTASGANQVLLCLQRPPGIACHTRS